jgi:hypothetical protein
VTDKKSRFAGIADIRRKLPEGKEGQGKTGRTPGKKGNPDFIQATVYLKKDTHATARKMLFDEHKQLSDLVEDLLSKWIAKRSEV